MNLKFILWLSIILLLLTGIILILLISYNKKINITTPYSNLTDSIPLSNLVNIDTSPFQRCKNVYGIYDNQRYYDINNDWTVINIDDPSVTIPSVNDICSDNISCINKLKLNGYVYPIPFARKDNTYFYVLGLGKVSCY